MSPVNILNICFGVFIGLWYIFWGIVLFDAKKRIKHYTLEEVQHFERNLKDIPQYIIGLIIADIAMFTILRSSMERKAGPDGFYGAVLFTNLVFGIPTFLPFIVAIWIRRRRKELEQQREKDF